jgi:hypothetical protein
MEYLMTYGWAILIIAVVLGVLFQLGVFSGSALTPKAAPGACQVVRLGGQASLEGECQGQLPQYVANFSGASTAHISGISDANFPSGTQQVSIFAWIRTTQSTTFPMAFIYGMYGVAGQAWALGIYNGRTCPDDWVGHTCDPNLFVNDGKWHFISFTYNGVSTDITTDYVDGNAGVIVSNSTAPNANVGSGSAGYIGYGTNEYFIGQLANIQLYNTSLSANEVHALYLEGIGGAPVKIQNLVGWWPLNGNAQDYSGNNDNGQAAGGVSFNSSWTSSYTP